MIERKIIISLITQTEYLRQLESEWNPEFIESATARLISNWCWEYFKKYRVAPVRDIETIYIQKLKEGNIEKTLALEIEQEILPSLSNEFEQGKINVTYILAQTKKYFKERLLTLHSEAITAMLVKHKVDEAIKLAENFKSLKENDNENELDLSEPEVLNKIESAFDTTYQNVIHFPGALGEFWNDQLVRGAFVSILSPEKRGKTFQLLELMMQAYKQKQKVALFQAGDMTENQQLIRICIYLARKSNLEKYCGQQYIPVQDCIKNQCNTCNKKIRECKFGIFTKPETEIRKTVTKQELIEAYKDNPLYKPCYNCVDWSRNKWGAVWLKEIFIKSPLNTREAKIKVKRFFIKVKRKIKLITYPNGTLTIEKVKEKLRKWREQGFIADVILIDYADLLAYSGFLKEFRHQQNAIWQGLRAISQEENCLVVAPTQSDAMSYNKDRLEMTNFSEDKRKYGHVTAMYGLNQDQTGREKELGIMRINKIVIREGDFHSSQEVYVLQRLQIGRPFLGSFY
ncbi:MAG: hypothetical protein M0R17_06295 [Candidatus Omnitrophica bacterium]|jgi:hypothetical protein|nr:hypothetical protein [Candidatus Omnitrophota bacterium]